MDIMETLLSNSVLNAQKNVKPVLQPKNVLYVKKELLRHNQKIALM